MFAGTVVFEDTIVTYQAAGDSEVVYTVTDAISGHVARVVCGQQDFFAAMAVAFSPEIIDHREAPYEKIEAVMPKAENLTSQPEDAQVETALLNLRWIP